MSLDKSLLVACGDAVVVVDVKNATATNDVTAVVGVVTANGVVVGVRTAVALVVWMQWCWMRPWTSPKSHFVSMTLKLRGNEPSWWYRQTTQGPHSTMGRVVCCQPWC